MQKKPRVLKSDEKVFIEEYLKTGSQYLAYLVARPHSKLWKKESAVRVAAWKLFNRPNIKFYIEAARKACEKKHMLTLESHLEELRLLREMAKEKSDLSSAIKAEVSRGKAKGLYVTRVELDDAPAPAPVAIHINVVDGRKEE